MSSLGFQSILRTEAAALKEAASEIWRECYSELLSVAQVDYMLEKLYSPKRLAADWDAGSAAFWIMVDGQQAGFLSYRMKPPASAHLEKIYLRKDFRKKGVGSGALKFVCGRVRESGGKELTLNVNKGNHSAIHAYLRNGFETVQSVCIDIGEGFFMDDFVLRKNL